MQPERLYAARKALVRLHPVEDVEPAIQILVLPKVEVDCMEDEPDGDIAVESGDEEPRAQVVPRDEARYAFPDLRRGSLRGGLVDEVDL